MQQQHQSRLERIIHGIEERIEEWRTQDAARKMEAEANREMLWAEAAERERREAEARRRKAEEDAARREAEAEERRRALAIRNRELNRLASLYAGAITSKIESNWRRPPNTGSVDCTVSVVQSINGDVLDVRVERCEGGELTPPLANAISRAVYASSPLPEPPDRELFDRRVRIRFAPARPGRARRRRPARARGPRTARAPHADHRPPSQERVPS